MKMWSALVFACFSLMISARVAHAAPSFTFQSAFTDGPSDLLNEPRSVKVQGDYAYVLSRIDTSITIFNISNPASPTKVGQIQDATNLSNKRFLEVSGNYVFAGGNTTTLIASYDVSNPASPTLADTLNTTNSYYDFDVSGDYIYAYGANSTNCFTVIDVSTPTNMQEITTASHASYCNGGLGGKIVDSRLYTYSSQGTDEHLTIFDISIPDSPTLLGHWGAIENSFNDPNCQDLEYYNNHIFCLGWKLSNVISIDVSNPAAPVTVDSLQDTVNFNTGLYAEMIGHYLIIGGHNSKTLAAVDVSDPTNLTLTTAIQDNTNLNNPYDFAVNDIYIYVPAYTGDILSIWSFDGLPPDASGRDVSLGDTSATVTWTTSEAASSVVLYGTTDSYGQTTTEADTNPRVTNHTVALTGLSSCTKYYYQVKGSDASGNIVSGETGTFATGCPESAVKQDEPDLHVAEGGNVQKGDVTMLVEAGTFPFDVYLSVAPTPKQTPAHFKGWWQVSDVYDVWFHAQFNEARVTDVEKPSVLVLRYEPVDLHTSSAFIFPEKSIRVAYSADEGTTWSILPNGVINEHANTVGVATPIGGRYMLVARAGYISGFASYVANLESNQ